MRKRIENSAFSIIIDLLQLIQRVHNYMSNIKAHQNRLEIDQIHSDSGSESDEFQNLSFGDDSQANQYQLASEILQPPNDFQTIYCLRHELGVICKQELRAVSSTNQREQPQILYNKSSSLNQKQKQENQLNLAIESLEFNNIGYQRLSSQNQTDEEWKYSETTSASAQIEHTQDECITVERKYSLGDYGEDTIIIQMMQNDIYATVDKTTIPITVQNVQKITYFYYQHQIPVPIVSSEIFTTDFVEIYMKYYLTSLFQINKQKLVEIMKKIEEKSFQIPKLKFRWIFNAISKICSKYSKPGLLKLHLDKKLAILQENFKHSKVPRKHTQKLYDEISKVQMLISFEKAIDYIRNEENYSARKKIIEIQCRKQYKRWVKKNCQTIDI